MTNIIDYVRWRGDISFADSPLNEVDALIFCELAYIPYDDLVTSALQNKGVPLKTLADKYFSLHYDKTKLGAIIPTEQIQELLKIASESKRFAEVCVRGYTNEVDLKIEKQFCAMCFDIDKNTTLIAFRGTDDTIIGWKEDFNMAFFTPIPAQKQSLEYVEAVIESSPKKSYYVAGHSKGGNLAIYSSITVKPKLQEKILRVFSFDGPGFKEDFLKHNTDNPIVPKITTILPQGAIIGAIFDTIGEMKYILSDAKGLYQHDGFTWELLGKSFIRASGPNKTSTEFHNTLEKWVSQLTEKEKIEFVDALYKFCTVNDSTTLTDIATDKLKFFIGVLKVDEQTRKTFLGSLNKLLIERYLKKEPKNPKPTDSKKDKTDKKNKKSKKS